MVLLKGSRRRGFVFYTNRERKAAELEANPGRRDAYWELQSRQVRIEGPSSASATESLAYFHTRRRASQVSAWASPQSSPRRQEELERRVAEVEQRFAASCCRCLHSGAATASSRRHRVLAGPAEPPARPRALRARRRHLEPGRLGP
jgi:pyridoxine/pyridoxamine 5'-phosphate oxidase